MELVLQKCTQFQLVKIFYQLNILNILSSYDISHDEVKYVIFINLITFTKIYAKVNGCHHMNSIVGLPTLHHAEHNNSRFLVILTYRKKFSSETNKIANIITLLSRFKPKFAVSNRKVFTKFFGAIDQPQAELHLFKVENLDPCIYDTLQVQSQI